MAEPTRFPRIADQTGLNGAAKDSEMGSKTPKKHRQEGERLQLPASSWWIPSLTGAVILLAILTAWA